MEKSALDLTIRDDTHTVNEILMSGASYGSTE